ncbi:hypothetical protein Q4I28_002472 [Leishmania naiffi]|uniref:Uncharacterized protein n=1 Tax=Leishmania naiffi TaxID=5678 RepID=A0AAW3BXZ8_9TRYP
MTTYRADSCQHVEIVSGTDGLLYLTNSLGLVSSLVHQQPTLDVSTLALPANVFSLAWEKCNFRKAKGAADMLELALRSHTSDEYGLLGIFVFSYLPLARFARGDDLDGAKRLFQRVLKWGSGKCAAIFQAAFISYTEGRACLSAAAPRMRSWIRYCAR